MRKPVFIKMLLVRFIAAILVYGSLALILAQVKPVWGLLVVIIGAVLLACLLVRVYAKLIKNNLELERACRTRLLEKYLSGDVPPEGELTEAMPELSGEYFAVATMQCIDFSDFLPNCSDEHIPPEHYLMVDTWMRKYISKHLEGISFPYFVPMTDGMIVLINVTGLDEENLDQSSRQKVADICEAIGKSSEDLKQHGLICGAVVSTVYAGRENIVKAYGEAEELTAYAELMGDSAPVKNGYAHAEISMDLSDKLLRTELEKSFMQSITGRNFAQLEKTMERFMDLELRTAARYPDLFKKHLISRMEQVLSAFSISVVDYEAEEAAIVNQFRMMMDMTSAQNLREQCLLLISTVKEYVEAENALRSDKVNKALRFIEEHYDDPGICADMIGDALGLSTSYVSRLLRQNTGMGVVDYIHSARLKKAKELLANTNLSVDDIAEQVGFASRWTLTRSFKRYEDTTPGAYRENAQRSTPDM